MLRNNRWLTRFFFVLVITIGLLGGWVTRQRVQITAITLTAPENSEEWIDLAARISDGAVQLFLGLMSGQ